MPSIWKRNAATVPLAMRPDGDVEVLRRRLLFDGVLDLVDLDSETGRQLPDGRAPGDAEHPRLEQHREVADLVAEAHDVEHHRRPVVGRVVGDLHGAHLLDALARSRQARRAADPSRIPGSTPVMKTVESPSRAASSMRSMYLSGITAHGYCNTPSPDPTTSIPAARILRTSAIASGSRVSPIAQYTMQSGLAAMIASRSLVAATPVFTSSPASSPASLAHLGSR